MRLRLMLAAALVALVTVGCATPPPVPGQSPTSSSRHYGVVSVVTAHAVLSFLQDQELGLVCGKAEAPAPPLCISAEKHRTISDKFVLAFDLDMRAAKLVRALPDGKSQQTDVKVMLMQIADIVSLILAQIPDSSEKAAIVRDLGGS